MNSRSPKIPQRIPPARMPDSSIITTPPPWQVDDGGVSTLASDPYALQAQLDQLTERVDQMKAQLRQAQKLASIGTTAAMIAHEFNNLLTPVLAYAQLAVDSQDVELMKKALVKTLERTGVLRDMADRVIGFAKHPDAVIKAVRVRAVVENAIGCLAREPGKDNIEITLQIDPALAVRANENQLLQVLFNLIINARQAMLGRRGRLTIDAAPGHCTDTGETPGPRQNGCVRIRLRDTGCGIAPEHLAHIFEPFFTTRQNHERVDRRGLGLGLSISRDILHELDGEIDVESELNVGTTFTLTLPRAE
jgi:signal transduction histidine kinase